MRFSVWLELTALVLSTLQTSLCWKTILATYGTAKRAAYTVLCNLVAFPKAHHIYTSVRISTAFLCLFVLSFGWISYPSFYISTHNSHPVLDTHTRCGATTTTQGCIGYCAKASVREAHETFVCTLRHFLQAGHWDIGVLKMGHWDIRV